jgi:hypothetical protein
VGVDVPLLPLAVLMAEFAHRSVIVPLASQGCQSGYKKGKNGAQSAPSRKIPKSHVFAGNDGVAKAESVPFCRSGTRAESTPPEKPENGGDEIGKNLGNSGKNPENSVQFRKIPGQNEE